MRVSDGAWQSYICQYLQWIFHDHACARPIELHTFRPWVRARSFLPWVDSQVFSLTSLPRASLAAWPPPPPPDLRHGCKQA